MSAIDHGKVTVEETVELGDDVPVDGAEDGSAGGEHPQVEGSN